MCLIMYDDELPPAYDMYRRLYNRTDYIKNVNRDHICNNNVKSNNVIVKAIDTQTTPPPSNAEDTSSYNNNRNITYMDADQMEE